MELNISKKRVCMYLSMFVCADLHVSLSVCACVLLFSASSC